MLYKNLHIIINPAAGQDKPILKPLNDAFHDAPLSWKVHLTQAYGDGAKLAREALEAGADLIGVIGGDGTVGDVVNGMYASDVPLAVLSGGTGNGVADAMGIDDDLLESTRHITSGENQVWRVDLGRIGQRLFILRVDAGKIVEVVEEEQEREDKDEWGMFAYYYAIGRSFLDHDEYTFKLTCDGETVERDAAGFILLNMSRRNDPRIDTETETLPDDGVFNMYLFRSGFKSALKGVIASSNVVKNEDVYTVYDGSRIHLDCESPLTVLADGEQVGETPVDIEVLPQAFPLLVPKYVAED